MTIEIERTTLVAFTDAQLNTQPDGAWDDNGGEPDGDMWLLPLDDVTPFDGMTTVRGYVVHAYRSDAGYTDFCGFSSRDVAYTVSGETAEAIALDEYGARQEEFGNN